MPLHISEMREHLQHHLAQQPTPGPTHPIPVRLNADEYTRAHTTAHTTGQTSKPPVHDRITDALHTEQSE